MRETAQHHSFMDLIMKLLTVLLVTVLKVTRAVLDFLTDVIFGFINQKNAVSLPPITNPMLLDSAQSLAFKIRTKKLKSKEVVESFIERIKEVNPILNAVVDQRFSEALKEAELVDEFLSKTNKTEKEIAKEKPFLGIPFTTKDCFKVTGLRQTVGLITRKDSVSEDDADIVKLMRNAGAIPIAVTNVSELCMWWESSNNVYGRTNNPYDTRRIVGGSSGGEACILSAAGSVIGIGSDIGGSIRMPAYFNGIFGHKPTTGIVSNQGQLPLAMGDLQVYLTTGPMCRYAQDLLPLFKVLASNNSNRLKLNENVDIKSLRYFFSADDCGCLLASKLHPDIKKAMKKVVYHLEKAHGIKAQKMEMKNLKYSLEIWSHKMGGADAPSFCEEMAERKGKINAYTELIKWFLWRSNHTLPAIMLGITESFTGKHTESYAKFVNMCKDLQHEFEDLLRDDGVLIYPTHPKPAVYHNQPIFMPFNFIYTAIFNVLGFPATQCPLGLNSEGLPLGVQVVSSRYNDHLTLAVACELEKAFGGWVSPSATL